MKAKRLYNILAAALLLGTALPCHISARDITIKVSCTEGQAPTLPAMVRNGNAWIQVKWDNTATDTERAEAAMTAGTSYTVSGIVLGTNQKVTAKVSVVKDNGTLPVAQAHPLPLTDVRLRGENLLTKNRDRDIDRLLTLDMSQQLYNYYDTYGISTKGVTVSDGWDSPDTKLKGHGTGHYLSALALAYAGIDDQARRERLLLRMQTIVNTMAMCQEKTKVWNDSLGRYFEARDVAPGDSLMRLNGTWKDFDHYKQDYKHYGYGYINAIPAQHLAMIEAYRPYNNEDWVWAPYYTVHKQLAGLLDVALLVDDKALADKALKVATDMGLWVWNRMHYRTYNKTDGTREERRAKPGNRYEMWNMYIAGEVGGMQEVLSHLAEVTKDPETAKRLTEAASCFDANAFYKPLSQNIDDIRTRHANQHIPMIIGSLRLYGATHATTPYYYNIASNFWNLVQGRYAYCTGGVGNGEMFRQPYMQMTSMLPNPDINETCCAYNLAKLTRDLACYNPNDARYMDYYERLLYNQIVGSLSQKDSIVSETGKDEGGWAVTYQYAVGLNASKPFGNETPQSTCCGGTGVENHVRYQETAYYVGGDTLWVNLYIPTVALWKEKGLSISMAGGATSFDWPLQNANLQLSGEKPCVVKLRVPYWATKGFSIKVNGKPVAKKYEPCSYVTIPMRQWKETDKIEIAMPYGDHLCYGSDIVDGYWLATKMHGPLCMVAQNIDSWDKAVIGTTNTFVPDYAFSDNCTHYLRTSKVERKANGLDTQTLEQAVRLANERENNYDAWARYGYRRMRETAQVAREIVAQASNGNSVTQQQVDDAYTKLNKVLNEMRPSTLAEPEDVMALQERVSLLRKNNPNPDASLKEKLDYADMVIKYVVDGSGTKDMIRKAMENLK